jgi:hypothetical protein
VLFGSAAYYQSCRFKLQMTVRWGKIHSARNKLEAVGGLHDRDMRTPAEHMGQLALAGRTMDRDCD